MGATFIVAGVAPLAHFHRTVDPAPMLQSGSAAATLIVPSTGIAGDGDVRRVGVTHETYPATSAAAVKDTDTPLPTT
jgi:hypothetical protein